MPLYGEATSASPTRPTTPSSTSTTPSPSLFCPYLRSAQRSLFSSRGRWLTSPLAPDSQETSPAHEGEGPDPLQRPALACAADNEFLVASHTGSTTLGVFVKETGEPTRGTLEWASSVRSLGGLKDARLDGRKVKLTPRLSQWSTTSTQSLFCTTAPSKFTPFTRKPSCRSSHCRLFLRRPFSPPLLPHHQHPSPPLQHHVLHPLPELELSFKRRNSNPARSFSLMKDSPSAQQAWEAPPLSIQSLCCCVHGPPTPPHQRRVDGGARLLLRREGRTAKEARGPKYSCWARTGSSR